MTYTLQERQNKILELLHHGGRVEVSKLSQSFGVSEVCIRKDLADLEARGLLSRVHGGAVSSYESYYNMSLAQRSNTNKKEKEDIARKIAEMVHDNQSVMMNAGTTTLYVMRELAHKHNITIVTNSIVLALEGAKYDGLNIILLGGNVNYEFQYVHGPLTLSQLRDFYADLFIMSADGIDAEHGISTFYSDETELCRVMMKQSKTVIAALDYTKLQRVTFRNISPADGADILVTNKCAFEESLSELRECVPEIVLA